jgi:hypothetical protein
LNWSQISSYNKKLAGMMAYTLPFFYVEQIGY